MTAHHNRPEWTEEQRQIMRRMWDKWQFYRDHKETASPFVCAAELGVTCQFLDDLVTFGDLVRVPIHLVYRQIKSVFHYEVEYEDCNEIVYLYRLSRENE